MREITVGEKCTNFVRIFYVFLCIFLPFSVLYKNRKKHNKNPAKR